MDFSNPTNVPLPSLTDTTRLAQQIAKQVAANDLLLLFGDLGSGKTTFVQELVHALGSADPVQSPTYAYLHTYRCADLICKHWDLYRVIAPDKLPQLGLAEVLEEPQNLVVIEWPEMLCLHYPQWIGERRIWQIYFLLETDKVRSAWVQLGSPIKRE